MIGKQCPWIAIWLPALLVVGIPQAPMNAEFHSAAARPLDALIKLRIAVNLEFEKFILLVLLVKRQESGSEIAARFLFLGARFIIFFLPLNRTGKEILTDKEKSKGRTVDQHILMKQLPVTEYQLFFHGSSSC